jgi:hypothetical protein
MIRTIVTATFIALGASLLAGCATSQGSGAYAPYYQRAEDGPNQYCGAIGTCAPQNAAPYAMRGNVD